jgi:plastocyanin
MSRHELVQGYLDGQLSRRVFIRRLVATGVSAAAALSYAGLLETTPAAAAFVDFYLVVDDVGFVPTPAQLQQGQGVQFANHSTHTHSARDTSGTGLFNTGPILPQGQAVIPALPGAGIYPYRCEQHTNVTGRLRVPILATPSTAGLGSSFTIRWASPSATLPSGRVFDVQRKRPGSNTFSAWRTGVTSKAASVTPTRRGSFAFRARVRRVSNGATSLWSAPATIQVT